MRRKSEKVRRAAEIAAEYEHREGRHKIRVKVLMTPFGGDASVVLSVHVYDICKHCNCMKKRNKM